MRFNWFGLIASMISLTLGGERERTNISINIFLALPMDMNELNFQPYPNGLQKRISKTIFPYFYGFSIVISDLNILSGIRNRLGNKNGGNQKAKFWLKQS